MIVSRKVSLLLQAADSVAMSGGVDPGRNARGIAQAWRRAHPSSLARLALLAGMRPPDPVLARQFLEELDARAR